MRSSLARCSAPPTHAPPMDARPLRSRWKVQQRAQLLELARGRAVLVDAAEVEPHRDLEARGDGRARRAAQLLERGEDVGFGRDLAEVG